MARMDLRLRRDAPGISLFWIILVVGAAVFLLVAIVLFAGQPNVEAEGPEASHDIVAGEGDEVPGTSSFAEGETAEGSTEQVPQVSGEAGELDEGVTDQAADSQQGGTVGAADATPADPAEDSPASDNVPAGQGQARESAGSDAAPAPSSGGEAAGGAAAPDSASDAAAPAAEAPADAGADTGGEGVPEEEQVAPD